MEKLYNRLKNVGAASLTLGIVSIVVGIATGTILIVGATKLFKSKKEIIF